MIIINNNNFNNDINNDSDHNDTSNIDGIINNNCDTDFEFHFMNCYFLKSSYITRVFLYNFFI
jgi:hypothetical protein